MLSVTEAKEIILSSVAPLAPRPVAVGEALDCVLAADIVAPINLPQWDNSAVDGYAVRSCDLAGATENSPIHLRVAESVPAGRAPTKPLEPLRCARIFTGAPIPQGADAVVMQEDTRVHHEGYIAVVESAAAGENIRRAGEDVSMGDVVLRAGAVLSPARLGMVAGLGFAEVMVHPRPRVGVLVTGAEIVEPGRRLGAGQIYDSNSYTLCGLVSRAGCRPVRLGVAEDSREALRGRIERGLSECDVVLTVGGVSVGEHDLVKEVLGELGCEQKFWKVAMKPGKPVVFATRGERIVFGLPGNPVSAAVTFLVLARPALLKLRGMGEVELPRLEAEAGDDLVNSGDRTLFLRAALERKGGKWTVRPLPRQGSHVITSLANADCLVEVGGQSAVRRGSTVKVMLLDSGR